MKKFFLLLLFFSQICVAQSIVPKVTSFTLVNAGSDLPIRTLTDGSVIDFGVDGTKLNIRANTEGGVSSVVYTLTGAEAHSNTDTQKPFSLFGDVNGNYNEWILTLGDYVLNATPALNGIAGTSLKINFSVKNNPVASNRIPTVNAGTDGTITLPISSITLTGTATDPDGTIAKYQWTKLTGPGQFSIASGSQAKTNVNNLVQGVYTFELRVTDNRGGIAADIVKVTVNAAPLPANKNPTANAGTDRSITLPTSGITLTGTGTDPDGTIAKYQWTKLTGPGQFSIASGSQAKTNVNNLVQGVYTFELRVTDNRGGTATDIVKVTVNAAPPPPNKNPTVNAGTDGSITLPISGITLTGTATDPDGRIAKYQWAKLTGPAQYSIASGSQAKTNVNNLVQGVYTFELRVTDNRGGVATDIVKVTVNAAPLPNKNPTANAGTDRTISLPTNSVTLTGTGTDPDGTIAKYLWTKLTGPAQFSIVTAGQAKTNVNNLVQGVYTFELRVTDNRGGVATDIVKVTVNAAPPPPNKNPTVNAGADRSITLPTNSLTLTGTGTDPDGTIAGYQWTKLTGPSQSTIVSSTQRQTIVNNLVQGVYSFQLRVTDNRGATATDVVNVTVNATTPPANQAPTANAGRDRSITLPTNSLTLTGTGTDPDGTIAGYQWTKLSGPTQFTIVSSTQRQTIVNNLVQGVYSFQLRVTDNRGATATDVVMVTVNATTPPANQAPTANAGTDRSITLPTNSLTLTGTGTDPDGTIAGYQWTKLSGPTQFTIVSPAQAQTIVNNLVQGVYSFQLRVTDNRGTTATDVVIVTVNATTPPANQAPTANAGTDRSITLPTSSLTLTGTGTDPDGTIAGYQWTKLSGPTQFTIVSSAQAQTIVNNLVQGVYSFQLRVTDNSGATATDLIMVTVNTATTPPTNRGGYYASPTGTGNGTFASPFRIADFWKVAKAGDTLNLLDGRYTGVSSMITPPQNLSGTATNRITILAFNDGKVDIDGERTNIPCKLEYNNYFLLEGFNVHHSPFQSSVITIVSSNNNIFKRVIGWESSDGNVNIWNLRASSNNLIEDCAGWGQARKIFGATQRADNNTFRRCFGRWEGSIVLGPKKVFTLSYNSYDNIAENCIGTWDALKMPQTYTLRNYDYTVNTDENNGSPTQYSNYQVHQPGGIFGNDGFDLGPTVPSDIANIKTFGCIAYLKQNQRYHNSPNRGNASPFDFYIKGIQMKDCISFIEPGPNHSYIQNVNLESTGGSSSLNTVTNLTRIGGVQEPWTIASSWSVTRMLSSPNCSAVTANGGGILNPANPSGLGAVVEKRYVNGVLTNENLWPWPMNQRIIDAMIQGGYTPLDITKEIFGLCGGTPPATPAQPTGDIVAVAKKWLASTTGRDSLEAILDSWVGNIDSVIQKVKPVPTGTQKGQVFYQSFNNPLFRQRYPDHQYHMYVPNHYSAATPMGLMIWLHGGGSWSATDIDHLAQYDMDNELVTGRSYARTETDNSNYILVAPIAPFGPVIPHPQHASRWDVPDADQYLMDIITEIAAKYNIDYNRVVIAGFSMGGIGAYHQALRLNDRLSAVMASAGSWSLGTWDGLKNMPMYLIHGVTDAYHNSSGCRPHNTAIEYARLAHQSLYKASTIHKLYEYPAGHAWDASGELYWKNFISGQQGWVTDKVRNPYRSNVTAVNPWRSYDTGNNFGVTWTEKPSPHTMWVSIKQTGTGTIPYDYAKETGTGGCSSASDFNNWSLSLTTMNMPGGKAEANITGQNQIVVTSANVTKMSLWLHPGMVNFNNPVNVTLNGVSKSYMLNASLLTALKSYERRWDWGMIYHSEIDIN